MTTSRVHLWITIAGTVFAGPLFAEVLDAATIRGRVESSSGTPVEHARVRDAASLAETYSDPAGRFVIDCEPPCRLEVEHPRFASRTVEAGSSADVVVVLTAKQAVYEEIVVTAARGEGDAFAPASLASTVVHPDERVAPASTLTELVEGVPAVSENGQGGLFQVFSIRGLSRHRVMTLIDGMRIVGPRRAGESTSFVEPLLMGSVEVLRGPGSTYYGSGALGGVVQIFPRERRGWSFETGWESFGDEHVEVFGWGDGSWSIGVARRAASDDEAADGSPSSNHFEQMSATILKKWQAGERRYEVLVVPAFADDIGKVSTDFPGRLITYPRERHLLAKLAVSGAAGGRFSAWIHPADVETETVRPGDRINRVDNDAFDFGAHYQRPATLGETVSARWGAELFGRRGVSARETEIDLETGVADDLLTLDDGGQDELAVYGSLRWSPGATSVQAGARLTWQRQKNTGLESLDDTAASGFVGLVRPLGGGWEATANLGTGLRFPDLSERFFTGTTGRGEIVANPDLEAERTLSTDLGVRWFGKRVFLSAQVFRLRIDDVVERVEIAPDVLVYTNLTAGGTIEGVEFEGFFEPAEGWRLWWAGHRLEGRDGDGGNLADVPADRLELGASVRRGAWEGRLRLQLRAAKDDPGSGEQAIGAAELLAASLSWTPRPGWTLRLRGENLLDEAYYNSADDKMTISPGRSIGVGLVFAPPAR